MLQRHQPVTESKGPSERHDRPASLNGRSRNDIKNIIHVSRALDKVAYS